VELQGFGYHEFNITWWVRYI